MHWRYWRLALSHWNDKWHNIAKAWYPVEIVINEKTTGAWIIQALDDMVAFNNGWNENRMCLKGKYLGMNK